MPDDKDSEIELLRRVLKDDLARRERDAQERIRDILAKKNVDFCSRCNRKVDDRLEWGGKCLGKDCENILCDNCWVIEKKRFCKTHKSQFETKNKSEVDAKKKVFFSKPAEQQPVIVDKEEDVKGKVESLVTAYIDSVKSRLQRDLPDWTPEEWLGDPKPEYASKNFEFKTNIYKKTFLSKKLKLQVFVVPLYSAERENIDFVFSNMKMEAYSLVVFVGYKLNSDTIEFVTAANNPNSSLMITEPKSGIFYTDKKQITKLYSAFFDPNKTAKKLVNILKGLADNLSDRQVLTTGKVAAEMGFSEYETTRLLDSCKFLGKVEGTDSYFFKLKW